MQINRYHMALNKLKIHTLASFVLICLYSYIPSFMRQNLDSKHLKKQNVNQAQTKKPFHLKIQFCAVSDLKVTLSWYWEHQANEL